MSIDSISNSLALNTYSTNSVQQTDDSNASATASSAAVEGGQTYHHHHHRGGGGMQALEQTLSQLGLTPQSSSDASTASSAQTAVGSKPLAANNDQRQALHAFMHDLFGALRSNGTGNSDSDGNNGNVTSANGPQGRFANISSKIQDLVQALSSSANTATPDGNLSNLQNDFQKLISALGTSSSTGSQSLNLSTFLDTLAKNFGGQQVATAAPGNIVSTSA